MRVQGKMELLRHRFRKDAWVVNTERKYKSGVLRFVHSEIHFQTLAYSLMHEIFLYRICITDCLTICIRLCANKCYYSRSGSLPSQLDSTTMTKVQFSGWRAPTKVHASHNTHPYRQSVSVSYNSCINFGCGEE